METNKSQLDRELDKLEELIAIIAAEITIAEIVSDPKVRAEMERIQPIDYEMN